MPTFLKHRSDSNQKEVVKELRGIGASVNCIGQPVDLLVGFRGINVLMEVKKSPKSKLRDRQRKFAQRWKGQVVRVNDPEHAIQELLTYCIRIGFKE